MKLICAWCKEPMGEKAPLSNTEETHGICPQCKAIQLKKLKIIPLFDLEETNRGINGLVNYGPK